MLLVTLMKKKLLEHFTKNNCKKQIKNSLELRKAIKQKGDKLHLKCKDYDSSFNTWSHKKDI